MELKIANYYNILVDRGPGTHQESFKSRNFSLTHSHSIHLYLSICLSVYLSIYPSVCLQCVNLSIYLSIYLAWFLKTQCLIFVKFQYVSSATPLTSSVMAFLNSA